MVEVQKQATKHQHDFGKIGQTLIDTFYEKSQAPLLQQPLCNEHMKDRQGESSQQLLKPNGASCSLIGMPY